MKFAFFSKGPSSFSGGRYLAFLFAQGLAENGHHVDFYMDQKPVAMKHLFAAAPRTLSLKILKKDG